MFEASQVYDEAYSGTTAKYIKWFFYLLLSSFVFFTALLFTIHIRDTVSFNDGEIIAANPQVDIKAPFEAQLSKVFVKEGKQVNAGDTLVEIYNEVNATELVKQEAQRAYLEKRLSSMDQAMRSFEQKRTETGLENHINYSDHVMEAENIKNNIRTLERQFGLQQEKLRTAIERTQADSILFHKDMLSKLEYNAGKDAVNSIRESINNTQRALEMHRGLQMSLTNELLKKQHDLKLKTIALNENGEGLQQIRIELQNELIKTNETIEQLRKEIGRQYLVSPASGVVSFIFNQKQASNLIGKGDLLLSLTPARSNGFYAKAVIPQNQVQYIKTGMTAQLRLDAYYHLEYGTIKGSVTYVSERKDNDKFHALLRVDNAERFRLKSGYSISGEIVTGRLLLFRYFLKKIFKSFEKTSS